MIDELLYGYLQFCEAFGASEEVALVLLGFIGAYLVIKRAVKHGILSAHEELEQRSKASIEEV